MAFTREAKGTADPGGFAEVRQRTRIQIRVQFPGSAGASAIATRMGRDAQRLGGAHAP